LRRRRQRVQATLDALNAGGITAEPPRPEEAIQEADLEQEDTDAEIIEQLLKNRAEQDLRWELGKLSEILVGSLYDVAPLSSKMPALLGYVEQRKDPERPGRIRQMVIFTQFWDTLEDIVRRFRQVDAKLLIGTYSGRGDQYTHPETGRLVGTERDEIKQRFLRGQIDILVCTDAAAEGLNLQTADYLVNSICPGTQPRSSNASAVSTVSVSAMPTSMCRICAISGRWRRSSTTACSAGSAAWWQ
jgi:hypothetical protein